MDEDDQTYGLIECQCCHDLHDVFQMRVDEYGNCYCDRCMSESIVIDKSQHT